MPDMQLTYVGKPCANNTLEHNGTEYTITHHFCGEAATPPTNGGDGGCKGSGGYSGKVQIFGMENQSNITISQQEGA